MITIGWYVTLLFTFTHFLYLTSHNHTHIHIDTHNTQNMGDISKKRKVLTIHTHIHISTHTHTYIHTHTHTHTHIHIHTHTCTHSRVVCIMQYTGGSVVEDVEEELMGCVWLYVNGILFCTKYWCMYVCVCMCVYVCVCVCGVWCASQFVADGVFYAELNEFLKRQLGDEGYSGLEVRVTPVRTEIIIRATRY